MTWIPHTPDEVRAMLRAIGAASIEELFEDVPAHLRERAALRLGEPLGEQAALERMEALAEANRGAAGVRSFLGAGAYDHFVPAAVDALASRGEFLTAYTPYQAEASQGTLQAIFEFQTLVCELTGLEVANASLYDGASATAEAVLMAFRLVRRRRAVLSAGLHPHYAAVVRTYLSGLDHALEEAPLGEDGRTPCRALPPDTAALVVQTPNFFGCIEDLRAHAAAAREAGALLVAVTTEPLALALLEPPGRLGADLACGEARSFGSPLCFGGPALGILAARRAHVRQMPGRLVGETRDAEGRRGFVMTLTTREQHIRRERATSNICTNQGLLALRATIYLALLGRRGLARLARVNYALARYARERLRARGLVLPYSAPVFNEFVVRVPGLDARLEALAERGILAGAPLARFFPERREELLVCVTERASRADVDALVEGLAG